jgi:hypothetical protein
MKIHFLYSFEVQSCHGVISDSMVSFLVCKFATPNSLTFILPNIPSNGLDLEMQSYQREHQCLQILDEVVEDTQSFGVLGFSDIDEGTNLGSLESAFS